MNHETLKRLPSMKHKPGKVLVVDDETKVLTSISRLLSAHDIDVAVADSGAEAMAIFERETFDVVLADYAMPGISGIELMAQIKHIDPHVVRVMLSAHCETGMMQKAINACEVFRFVPKPWDNSELLATLAESLENRFEQRLENNRLACELNRSSLETVMALAEAIELKDIYTKGHCSRVKDYSMQIAFALDLPSGLLIHLAYAALLHDCGKIGVPRSLILKNGALSGKERKVIEQHSVYGFELTTHVRSLKTASIFIRQHHERWDGKGYPDGLSEDQSHVCSRIISVTDAFDAMTTDRPYRPRMTEDAALQLLIDNRGTQFDPELVKVFVDIRGNRSCDGTTARHAADAGPPDVPCVLFVDDETLVLESLKRVALSKGYTVLTASNAEQAFGILAQTAVDIVISDQKMPGMTGVAFLKKVKDRHPGIVRILLSGHAELDDAMAAINEAGIYKFLQKPWGKEVLEDTLHNALEYKQLKGHMHELLAV